MTELLPGAMQSIGDSRRGPWHRRIRQLWRAWTLFRTAPKFDVVITVGALDGLAFAALQRFRTARPVHVMYDCLWYGGNAVRRAWMRFCLRQVDRCVVWASVECDRYAEAYGLPKKKFSFVAHHHTLKRYNYEVSDEKYVFSGGNADRDFGLFFEAVRDLPVACVLATNRPQLLEGLNIPDNVRVVSVNAGEFRQLMAAARIVVMPMRATLLHAGGQQSILNAMFMAKPVVLTDPEGGSDYIENGKTGVLVPYGDAAALRQAIERLWNHCEEARIMGEQARAAAQRLSTDRCNNEIWQMAIGIANGRSAVCEASDCLPSPKYT
jgi:glycosyltransferase involved in cell wall biosynthesis